MENPEGNLYAYDQLTYGKGDKNIQQRGGWSQDGRGIGQGDHFPPKKLIKRSFEC